MLCVITVAMCRLAMRNVTLVTVTDNIVYLKFVASMLTRNLRNAYVTRDNIGAAIHRISVQCAMK